MNHQKIMELLSYFDQLPDEDQQELNETMRQKIAARQAEESPE